MPRRTISEILPRGSWVIEASGNKFRAYHLLLQCDRFAAYKKAIRAIAQLQIDGWEAEIIGEEGIDIAFWENE